MKKSLLYFLYYGPIGWLFCATTATWTGASDASWTNTNNWSPKTVPQNQDDIANLTGASPSNTTISLGSTITLKELNLDLAAGYTLNGGGGSFIFNTSSGNGSITVTTTNGNGDYTINANIALSKSLTVTQGSTGNLEIAGVISGSSYTLTKEGTGTLTLSSGANTYSSTTINAGTVSISSDADLGTSANTVTIENGILEYTGGTFSHSRPISLTGSATLSAASGTTATVSGTISGTGSLSAGSASSGVIVLTGSNEYEGGTTVSSGELQISSDSNLGDSSGALNFGSGILRIAPNSITIPRSGNVSGAATIISSVPQTFSGNFTGGGSLTFFAADFTLAGTNDYTGGTTISATTQLAGTTNAIQGNITLNENTSFLTFSQNFDGTYSGSLTSAVLGAGAITKLGTGTVAFSGSSTGYSGPISVVAGTLEINNSLTNSTVTVESGATLAGTGIVGGGTTSSGTVAPGSGTTIGTLNVSGAVTFNSGSTLGIHIAPSTNDLLEATGIATVTGASLVITPTEGFYGFGSRQYTIVTGSSLVQGFTSVSSTLAGFVPSISYTATSALLNVTFLAPFSFFPFSNENTRAVGDNLDSLYAAGELSSEIVSIFDSLVGQSFATINNALDQLHPAPYSAFIQQQNEMGAQLISLFHKAPFISCGCGGENRFWFEPFGNTLHMKRHGIQEGFQANSGGVALGFDTEIASNWSFGFGGAWNTSHLDWEGSLGRGEVNGFYGAAYTDYQYEAFYLGAAILSGIDFYDTTRNIKFVSTHRHAEASYHSLDVIAQIKTAYLFGAPQAFFYPYANFDYLYFQTGQYTETGAGGLSLTVDARSDGTLRTEMGLGLKVQDTNYEETACISPEVSLGWVNMCPLSQPKYRANFVGTTIPFSVRGWDETWNLFHLNFALGMTYQRFNFKIQYSIEFSPNSNTTLESQHGNLHFGWTW